MWTLLLIIGWVVLGPPMTTQKLQIVKFLPVHLISDDQLLLAFQPFSKPSHLSMHIGHCLGKRGFLLGSKSSPRARLQDWEQKNCASIQSKRTRRPSLSFRALLMVHFVVACWRAP